MYPEDRVLVGVINRKRDLKKAQVEHWYRVPQGRASQGIYAEYVAFFLSRSFGEMNGAVHYYARRTGLELVRRVDLLPDEPTHPRAQAIYHKLQLGELRRKEPPIVNADRRVVTFIHTTWDRFMCARTLADLYSEADEFVDRVFHALERRGVKAERTWETDRRDAETGAQLRIECQDGTVIASTLPENEQVIPLPVKGTPDAFQTSLETILDSIRQHGGPLMISVPLEE